MRKDRPSAAWIVAVAVLLAGCTAPVAAPSPSPEPSIESIATAAPLPTPEATPDPAAPCKDCWPLTGKPLKVGAVDKRPLVVKIDNVPLARPHYGITQADMVFEILVEGFVTRLAAVYQSQDAQTIGNIRSVRWTISDGRVYDAPTLWRSVRFQP